MKYFIITYQAMASKGQLVTGDTLHRTEHVYPDRNFIISSIEENYRRKAHIIGVSIMNIIEITEEQARCWNGGSLS